MKRIIAVLLVLLSTVSISVAETADYALRAYIESSILELYGPYSSLQVVDVDVYHTYIADEDGNLCIDANGKARVEDASYFFKINWSEMNSRQRTEKMFDMFADDIARKIVERYHPKFGFAFQLRSTYLSNGTSNYAIRYIYDYDLYGKIVMTDKLQFMCDLRQ